MARKQAPPAASAQQEDLIASMQTSDEDSVDQVFGGDYSEDTLAILRAADRAYIEQEKIEDPEKDPWEWAATQPYPGQLPQPAYDETRQFLKEKIDALKALREQDGLDPEQKALVDYKRSLVDGKSYNDIAWLKFHAYERAQSQLQSHAEASAATPPEVFQGQMYKEAGEYTAHSEESEWAPDWRYSGYLPYTGPASTSGRAAHTALAVQPRTLQQVGPFSAGRPQQEGGSQGDGAEQDVLAAWAISSQTLYNPLYLEEQELARQVRAQRVARRSAFALSFAAALGFGLLKWWRSRQRGRTQGKAGPKAVPN